MSGTARLIADIPFELKEKFDKYANNKKESKKEILVRLIENELKKEG